MYTYNDLLIDVRNLKRLGAEEVIVGNTVLGADIPCLHVGDYGANQIIVQGAIHAREYITSELVVRQIYHTIEKYGTNFAGGIYFVPMVNIDGVNLCQYGLSAMPPDRRAFLRDVNAGSTNFAEWKANANAVDLNTNFDARWGTGVQNVRYPAPEDYIGPSPNSEPETQMLVDLTKRISATLTISYHARGNVIYWDFYQTGAQRERDRQIGGQISALTTYPLIDGAGGSAGGYKDWCIEKLGLPAYTIEIIAADTPFPIPTAALLPELEKNKDVPHSALQWVKPYL